MSIVVKAHLWFEAAFPCSGCGAEIEIKQFRAVIEGPGARLKCRICSTRFLVKADGAHVVEGVEESPPPLRTYLSASESSELRYSLPSGLRLDATGKPPENSEARTVNRKRKR